MFSSARKLCQNIFKGSKCYPNGIYRKGFLYWHFIEIMIVKCKIINVITLTCKIDI